MDGFVYFFDEDFVAVETGDGLFTIFELFDTPELQIGDQLKWPDGVRGRIRVAIVAQGTDFEGAIQYVGATRSEVDMLKS